jgi:hypothetical protein
LRGSGKPIPRSGIPLKDIGLFERYADSVNAPAPMANQMHKILERE